MFTDEQLHHPLLTHDQEITLARRIQAGNCDALDELVRHNLRLVYKVASSFNSTDTVTDFDDLIQEGLTGLLHAAEKFDPDRDTRFSTYAVWWIRQRIWRCINTAGPIKRDPNPSRSPSIKPNAIRNHALRQAPIASLDEPLHDRRGDDSDSTLADILSDMSQSVEDIVLSAIEVERMIADLHLNSRGDAIVRDWLSGFTRTEAQAMHGVSRSWLDSVVLRPYKEKLMPRESYSPNCIEDGCNEPKYVNDKGQKFARCHEHQKAFWAAAARAKAAASRQGDVAAGYTHEPASRDVGRIKLPRSTPTLDEIEREAEKALHLKPTVLDAVTDQLERQNIQASARTRHPLSAEASLPGLSTSHPPVDGCSCEDCIYREIVSMLSVRNPRIAELVDVMQTARRLRDDLGI